MGAYQIIVVIFLFAATLIRPHSLQNDFHLKYCNVWLIANFGNWDRIIIDKIQFGIMHEKSYKHPVYLLAPEMVVESRQAWNSAKWECQFGNRARKFGVTAAKMHFEHPTIWQKICSTNLDGIYICIIHILRNRNISSVFKFFSKVRCINVRQITTYSLHFRIQQRGESPCQVANFERLRNYLSFFATGSVEGNSQVIREIVGPYYIA